MTSGSFQTQPRLLYVELCARVGQMITMKSNGSYIHSRANSMLNEFFPTQLELQAMQCVVVS